MTDSNYYLRIYDNFNYMDEDEAYNMGSFATEQEAENAAKKIVEEFFRDNLQEYKTVEELSSAYYMFGEDPVVFNTDKRRAGSFSAWSYAKTLIKEMKDGQDKST